MGRPMILAVLFSTSLALPALAANETTVGPAGAQTFLEMLYQTYLPDQAAGPPLQDSRVYDASTSALLAVDHRLNEGFPSAVGVNPLCQCKHATDFHADIKVARWKAKTAIAHVQIADGPARQELTIDLV